MSDRVVGRAIGAFFLAAFLCYGVGSLLVESVGASDQIVRSVQDHPYRLSGGASLMLANSVVVTAIGVLAHRHLRPTRPTAAVVYLATRVFEAVLLAVGVVFALLLIPLSDQAVADGDALAAVVYAGNDIAFQVAMIGLAVGSVWFCWALYKDQSVHRTLALWD